MLHQTLRDVWLARLRNGSIDPVPRFTERGLTLGVGTVLRARDGGDRRLQEVKGQEARLVALLSAACDEVLPGRVASRIERAVKCWSDGDDHLAYIHLAHAGLPTPSDVPVFACRLLAAEIAMDAGVAPQTILQALKARNPVLDEVKKFDPNEPRVPAGSGLTSGEWTDSAGSAGEDTQGSYLLGRTPPPMGSFLGELGAAEVVDLGLYASRLVSPIGAAVAAFGLLFIPSPNNVRVEGNVPEIPGLRYGWNRDETLLRLTYDDPDGGQRIFAAQLDGDVFRDVQGRVIGRVLSDSTVAIDAAAVSSDLVDDDEPRLCPDPVKDKRTNDLGLDYENYIKTLVNPENPTPTYMGYMLPKIAGSVAFDDCEHSTGTMVEIKDGYSGFLNSQGGRRLVEDIFLDQAMDQVQAAGNRPVRWYFSQKAVADYARKLFGDAGLNIAVKYEPWPGSKK